MLMAEYVRTTIKLREDVYQTLKKEAGTKKLSEMINEILINTLLKKRKACSEQWKKPICLISGIMRTDYNAAGFFCLDGIFHGDKTR